MQRYYFDIVNGNGLERDVEGQDCASLAAAKSRAISTATRIAYEEFPSLEQSKIAMTLRDADGETLLSLQLELTIQE